MKRRQERWKEIAMLCFAALTHGTGKALYAAPIGGAASLTSTLVLLRSERDYRASLVRPRRCARSVVRRHVLYRSRHIRHAQRRERSIR
ncbi:hypothetical protein [Paraburkholderia tagetis]|nr:hypothetical protein [Paraburkholderia tagetis]